MPTTAAYDREADALYVRLTDGTRHRTVEIDDTTYVDLDEDGRAVGLELLYPSLGMNLAEAARRFSLERQLPEIISAINASGSGSAAPTMTGGSMLASTAIVTVRIEGTVPAAAPVASSGISQAERPVIEACGGLAG